MWNEMTAEDIEILKVCPEGWFMQEQLPDTIKDRAVKMHRLMDAGKIELHWEGISDDSKNPLRTLYRKRDWGKSL